MIIAVITGMAVTGATTAGGNNIMNGEAIAGTHTDCSRTIIIIAIIVTIIVMITGMIIIQGRADITAEYS